MEQETIEIAYERAGNGKRAAAFLADAFLSLVTGAILLILTFYLLSISPVLNSINTKREEIQLSSNLYIKDDDSIIKLKTYLNDNNELTTIEKIEIYEESLSSFYVNDLFFSENEGLNIYLDYKSKATDLESNKLFNEDGERIYSDAIHQDSYKTFYENTYDSSLSYLYLNNEYRDLNRNVILIDTFSIIGTLLFPFIIYCFIIPLCSTRYRQTIGMRLVKIALVDVTGLSVKWYKLTFRFLFFYIIELWGSLFTFLIPFIVSLTMTLLSKSHQSLSDYIFNTYMVSSETQVIYKDVIEYKLANKNKDRSNSNLLKND